jgi:hypothetical protein
MKHSFRLICLCLAVASASMSCSKKNTPTPPPAPPSQVALLQAKAWVITSVTITKSDASTEVLAAGDFKGVNFDNVAFKTDGTFTSTDYGGHSNSGTYGIPAIQGVPAGTVALIDLNYVVPSAKQVEASVDGAITADKMELLLLGTTYVHNNGSTEDISRMAVTYGH